MKKLLERKLAHLFPYFFLAMCIASPLLSLGQTPDLEKNPISGFTPGSSSVSSAGSVNYFIPLMVSPSALDVAPKLALYYANNTIDYAGNFGLSDLPCIQRSGLIKSIDGTNAPIGFFPQDKATLGNDRLFAIKGNYWFNGTEYVTEHDAYKSIKSFSSVLFVTDYFVVKTKEGLIMEFGNSSDSRFELANSSLPLKWMLSRIQDQKGNYITYHYHEDRANGEIYPTEIRYGGNTRTGQSPNCRVVFEYEDRPDARLIYLKGNMMKITKRLKRIVSFYQNQVVRKYELEYTTIGVAKQSALAKLIEYGKGQQHLNPTTFEYTAGNVPLTYKGFDNPIALPQKFKNIALYQPADFNNDGINDALIGDPVSKQLQVMLGSRNFVSQSSNALNLLPKILSVSAPSTTNFEANRITLTTNFQNGIVSVGDYNGDAKQDVAFVQNGIFKLFLSRCEQNYRIAFDQIIQLSDRFFGSILTITSTDFDGNGIDDVLFLSNDGTSRAYLSSINAQGQYRQTYIANPLPNLLSTFGKVNGRPTSEITPVDLDGDAIQDLVVHSKTSPEIIYFRGTSSGFFEKKFTKKLNSPTAWKTYFVDTNADLLPDLIEVTLPAGLYGGMAVYLNTGNYSFANEPVTNIRFTGFGIPQNGPRDIPPVFIDINLDNHVDVLMLDAPDKVYLGVGNGKFVFDTKSYSLFPTNYNPRSYTWIAGRFFTTPSVNFLAIKNDNSGSHFLAELYTEPQPMLTRITNGHGKTIEINYQPTSKDYVYRKDENFPATFPQKKYAGPLYVVSSIVEKNGSKISATRYNYENGVLDAFRGFLGFAKVIINNVTQGSTVENFYELDHAFSGDNLRSSRTYQGGILVASTDRELSIQKKYPSTYNVLLTKQTERTYDPVNGQLLSLVSTTYNYDAFGNALNVYTTYSDGRQEKLFNTYTNDPDKFIIGRLIKSRREFTGPNGTTVQKNSAFEYDSDGWLSKEIIEPGNDSLVMTSEYKRDLQGNIIQTKVTAWDGQKISTRVKSFVFDKEGRFMIKKINEAGFESTMEYHPGTGKQLSATDPNGLVMSTKYDDFGRPSEVTFPDKSWARFGYFRVSNYPGAPGAVHVKVQKTSKGTYEVTFYNTEEQVVREEKLDKFDRLIAVDYVYDAKGNLELKSLPYFKGQPIKWIKYLYDVVGRLVSTQMPDGTQTTIVYQGLATTFTNELGLKTRVLKDIHGNDIEITDARGNVVKKQYDLDGNLLKTNFGTRSITYWYDLRGQLIEMRDPSAGITTNKYNGFGELIQSVTPNGIIRLRYDDLGRPIERWDGAEKTTLVYDTEWLGKISEIIKPDVLQSFHYDSLGRPTVERKVVLGRTFVSETRYNTSGDIQSLLYPSGKTQVDFEYKMGEINAVKMAGQVLWTLAEQDIWGNATSFIYGNGIKTVCKFDPVRGWMLSTEASNQTGKVQAWEFAYNALGSVIRQRDHRAGKEEHYTYDDLNQLTTALIPGVDTLKMTYNKYGELTSKSDVGQYFWNSKGQLDSILLNEGVDCALNQRVTYTPFGKVKSIISGNQRIEIVYDANYQRVAQKRWENGRLVRTRYYLGLTEVDVDAKGIEVVKDYISNGAGAFAIRETGTFLPLGKLLYMHTNHQGSVVAISDVTGVVIETLCYDPWGKRRAADWTPLVKPFVFVFDRGYTMHEHLDPELINMNGRVFDPQIGIFLSPDPVYQSTNFTHFLGRYAYVGNNPVSLIDPSGYFSLNPVNWAKSTYNYGKDHWKGIVTTAAAVAAGAVVLVGTGDPILAGMASGFIGGLTGALLNGQSLVSSLRAGYRGAIIGGISAGLTAGVGHGEVLPNLGNDVLNETARATGHGIIQGSVSAASGGDFWSGAAAGFASSAISSSIEASGWKPGYAGNVAISATIGGVSAEVTGGNFFNGAISGAFVYMYNHGLEHYMTKALEIASDLSAGFGDDLTFGLTKDAREFWGIDDVVDNQSMSYLIGQTAETAFSTAYAGMSIARGFGWTSKVMLHGPHHTFGAFGKLSHVQINYWKLGVKGSGGTLLRVPLPWK